MATSEITENNKTCNFCKKVTANYTCPKCNYNYCSLSCYKDKNHVKCSEEFYKEWVMTYLQNEHASVKAKKKMVSVLKKHKKLSEEDSTESLLENIEKSMTDLNISLNITKGALWKHLTESEKLDFLECVKNGNLEHVIPVWKPWWTIKSEPKLVEELETSSQENSLEKNILPPLPEHIPKLSSLTSINPSNCIKYNLINVIYSYACVTRLYNGEHLDLPEEVTDCFLFVCSTLSENQNFGSVEDAVFVSVNKIVTERSAWNMSKSQALDIVNDVLAILKGPSEKEPSKYILCALADIKTIVKKAKKYLKAKNTNSDTNLKIVTSISRRMDYFMSWAAEYFIELYDVVSNLELLCMSSLESKIFDKLAQNVKIERCCSRKLIEELD